MTITAFSGPILGFGTTLTSTAGTGLLGADQEHNGQRGPSVFDIGQMLMDPRVAYAYQPGSGANAKTLGFYAGVANVDYVPATANTSYFAAIGFVSTANAGAAISVSTLGSSALGTYATTIVAPETGQVTGTLIALDSTAAYVTFGSDGTVAAWNPGAGTGRCLQIITSSSGDGGSITVAGRDMYGYKMTEAFSIAGGTSNSSGYTIKGKKAFKYISAIVNTSTPTSSSISIGFTDTFGFPFAVPYCGSNTDVRLLASAYSSAVDVALSSASVVLASTVATATSTTPDARGTYASTTATNGTLRLQMTITPSASAAATITSTNVAPLFGQAQFSSV